MNRRHVIATHSAGSVPLSLVSTAAVAVVDALTGTAIEGNDLFDGLLSSLHSPPAVRKDVGDDDDGDDDRQDMDVINVLQLLHLPGEAAAFHPTSPVVRNIPHPNHVDTKKLKIQAKAVPNDDDKIFIEIQTIDTEPQPNADDDEPTRTGDGGGGTTVTERIDRPILQRLSTVMRDPQEAEQVMSNLRVDFTDLIYLNRIGEGSFGDIFRAKYRGMTVAAKRIKKEATRSGSDGDRNDDLEDNNIADGSFRMGRRMSTRTTSSHFVSDEKDDVRDGKRLSSARNLNYRKSEDGNDGMDFDSDDDDEEEEEEEEEEHASAISDFRREVQVLKSLRHPNIVLLLAYATMPNNAVALYELMDCSLLDLLQQHEETKTKMKPRQQTAFAIDLCSGMHYLHSCRPLMVLHRDLKPSNCLIDSYGRLKLCDFGLSKLVPADREQREASYKMTGETGTYRFMAPEVYRREPHYDEKVDVYSFAMIFYNLLSGQAPWPTTIGKTVVFMTSRGERPPLGKNWDPRLQYLLKECWHPDHTMRPSFARILDTLTSYQTAVYENGSKNSVSSRRRRVGTVSLRSVLLPSKKAPRNNSRLVRGASTNSRMSLFSFSESMASAPL